MENPQDQNSNPNQSQNFEKPPQQPIDQPTNESKFSPEGSQQSNEGNAGQSDTATDQRSAEGGASTGQSTDTGFVGSASQADSSSELIEEDDPDFAKDGQGSVE